MLNIKHVPMTIEEYSERIFKIAKEIAADPHKAHTGVSDFDITNALGTIKFGFLIGAGSSATMGLLLTLFFEKGYKEGMEAAEAKLSALDKKMEVM